ncbi:hypothetical protein CPB86DRAFT_337782, partial [Serendipita vermifera]
MTVLILEDTTIESSIRDDSFLKGITCLVLEVAVNGLVVDAANLSPQQSNLWLWEAVRTLAIHEVATDFMISVMMDDGENKRQKIAFMEINGLELSNTMRKQYEIPLRRCGNYPGLVLKTKARAIEDIEEPTATSGLDDDGQGGDLPHGENALENMLAGAEAAYKEFERHGKLEDLEQALSRYRAIIEVIPESDPNVPDTLNNLGVCLLSRFEQIGNLDDLDGAVERHQAAISLTPNNDEDKPSRLSNLANALCARFERLGNLDDLHNAIQKQEAAVCIAPDGDPNKPGYLNNLGSYLQIKFERFGCLGDMEDAIVHIREAVNLTGDTDPDKPMYLTNLGSCLSELFLHSGNITDIDDSVAQQQLAVSLTADGHPNRPAYLSNLGNSLYLRFERLENPVDLDSSIMHQQRAVNLTPNSHLTKPTLLDNLGNCLNARYRRLGKEADINSAILQYQIAVNLTPAEHLDKPRRLNHLGTSLGMRFDLSGNFDDIDSAIAQNQMAVDLIPSGHPDKPRYLVNLGNLLGRRFKRSGDLANLDEAIKYEEKALELTPSDHPRRSSRLIGLSHHLLYRFNRFHTLHDGGVAISHLSAAAASPGGPPTMRFKAVDLWIKVSSIINHDSLLAAYGCALDLLPLVAWLGLPIANRHQHLIKIGGIVREAVSAAISADRYDKALEWLEQGRSIVWTQILQLRTPVDELREVNSALAGRLLQVARLLDHGSQLSDFSDESSSSLEEEERQYRKLTAEWESIIKQVQSLPGFKDFLRPLSSSQLRNMARGGPVVVLNVSKARCDALALVPGLEDVIHIPLTNVTSESITNLRNELKDRLYSSGIRMREIRATERVTDDADKETCRRILAELWTNLVKPVLDSLAFSPHPDVLPRIWWCTTGPLAFLPIHAAGLYGSDSDDSQLSSYAISSYIPTLSTLLEPAKATPTSSFKLLSVIQPSAPDASFIPNTKKELEYIQQRLS